MALVQHTYNGTHDHNLWYGLLLHKCMCDCSIRVSYTTVALGDEWG